MTPDEFQQVAEMIAEARKQIRATVAGMERKPDPLAEARRAEWERRDKEMEVFARQFRHLCRFRPARSWRRRQNSAG